MDLAKLQQLDEFTWRIDPLVGMNVPAILYANRQLIEEMDEKVYTQATNVARLPGIVSASYAMPDAHWGYGFPIGGVAAFDPELDGVVSAGGVGFDISCGVRTLLTDIPLSAIEEVKQELADALYQHIPVGLGSRGQIVLSDTQLDHMLTGGARWAVEQGYGEMADLERIEERGCMPGAQPEHVSQRAKQRQQHEMGTLGSGNHYLEVQRVADIFDATRAAGFGLREDQIIISIHCGSRGLGHQIGTDFLREMVIDAGQFGIHLPDRELACAPLNSPLGQRYLGAMAAAINCSFANRQIITHLVREVFARFMPQHRLHLLFDVSHNTCKLEQHLIEGQERWLYVHRKGATRAFPPNHPTLPDELKPFGQPVIIGGSMGTCSYILAGTEHSRELAFSSACHGAGRAMSRRQAGKQWQGRRVIADLANQGIEIRSPSLRGVAEEAPGAYKDVTAVVDVADKANLARKVARLLPVICVKG
jgi:tRNA-splicing ligase RtcB